MPSGEASLTRWCRRTSQSGQACRGLAVCLLLDVQRTARETRPKLQTGLWQWPRGSKSAAENMDGSQRSQDYSRLCHERNRIQIYVNVTKHAGAEANVCPISPPTCAAVGARRD